MERWWENSRGFGVESGRRSILTENEKQKYILKFVAHKNLIGEAVDYKGVLLLRKPRRISHCEMFNLLEKMNSILHGNAPRLSLRLTVNLNVFSNFCI